MLSNGKRVGKLSIVVEGTFMSMRDFLPHRNTASSHSCFAQDDRMLGAVILHQILSETWGCPSGNNPQNSAGFQ
jgi:hypothetical protein